MKRFVPVFFAILLLAGCASKTGPGQSGPFFDQSFWRDFISNGVATLIGVIIGIPVAIWLSTKQQSEQEKKEREKREHEATERKAKILQLIEVELRFNRDHIEESRETIDGKTKRTIQLDGLKDELWGAFSDGGELEWIRDLELLNSISFAYHYIRRTSFLERKYLDLAYHSGPISEDGKAARSEIVRWLVDLDPRVLEKIGRALDEIGKSLKSLRVEESVEGSV